MKGGNLSSFGVETKSIKKTVMFSFLIQFDGEEKNCVYLKEMYVKGCNEVK